MRRLASRGRPPSPRAAADDAVAPAAVDGGHSGRVAVTGGRPDGPPRRPPSWSPTSTVVFPTVVAMVGLRLVFAVFPLADIVSTGSVLTRFGGSALLLTVAITQVIVFRWLLTGRPNSPRLRALAVAELALTLAGVLLFGRMWVAMPALGLVNVLLLLRGTLRVALAAAGVVVYVVALALLHDARALLVGLAEFAMATLVLHLLPRLVLTIRELDAARRELTGLAIAEDRLRVARDLHDTLGQRLSVALLKLDVAKRAAGRDPERYRHEIAEAQESLRVAVTETQKVVSGLRSASLVVELDGAREVLQSAGISTVARIAEVRVDPAADEVLAWVLREATTNVLRHSSATLCDIRLVHADGLVELRIHNDRPLVGHSDGRTGNGLVGIGERLREVGGHLRLHGDDQQFELVAVVPERPS